MNDETVERAVAFLVTMRPQDDGHGGPREREMAYRREIQRYLQVKAALDLAGRAQANRRIRCTKPGCGWSGLELEKTTDMIQHGHCPKCNGITFERSPE